MKTAISIPDPVFEAAENVAKRLKVSRSQLYALAVSEFLQRHNDEEITQRLNEVYSSQRSDVEPGTQAMQIHALKHSPW